MNISSIMESLLVFNDVRVSEALLISTKDGKNKVPLDLHTVDDDQLGVLRTKLVIC